MQVYPEACSFEVKVDGFSHKLPLLTARILETLAQLQVRAVPCTLKQVLMLVGTRADNASSSPMRCIKVVISLQQTCAAA